MNLKDFPPFGRDQNRFQWRLLNGDYQVHGADLKHVCMCQSMDAAEMICKALNAAPDWHDRPTGPGLWVCMTDGDTRVRRFTQVPLNMNPGGYRYYGPIPEHRQ